ncbi:type II secretion system protein GspK [Caulifigura coniformis]|nr:type II secretion system protein GspK [Caulifigura coniformis]
MSMAIVLESAARQGDLQDHWARESLKTIVLRNAPRILMPPGRATAVRTSLSHVVTLRGLSYRLILADEDAKLPVNTVRRMLDPETAARIVESACSGTRLRKGEDRQAPFGAWEEALKFNEGMPGPEILAAATGNVTLWGSGRINVNRARSEVVAALMTEAFSSQTADRLLEIIGRGRVSSLQDLASKLALNMEQRQKLERLAGATSDAYSLWILPTRGRNVELQVVERMSQQHGGTVSFHW